MKTSISRDSIAQVILGALVLKICIFSHALAAKEVESPSSKPNIVIIMADDMGYGDLSSYGHPNIVTPNLDKMASEGLKLTSFYAGQAVCTPSRAALMTGRYAIRSNMTEVQFPGSKTGIPQEELTMAEMLKGQGYQTAMVGKWHLGDNAPHRPSDNGFDSYYGLLYSNDMIAPWVTDEMTAHLGLPPVPPLTLYRDTKPEKVVENQSILTSTYTKEAVTRISNFDADSPFFLYMAYSMPHLPVAVPTFIEGKYAGGLYGGAVSTIDWSVGEILKALDKKGALNNTLVVFFSDNGPWQNLPDRMVQGGVERWHVGSSGTLRGSKGTSYEGGSRVPAIVRWPNATVKSRVSSELTSAIDLFPTVAAMSGAKLPSNITLDGQDLSDFFSGKSEKSKVDEFFYFRGDVVEAVRISQWKLRLSPFDELSQEHVQQVSQDLQVELYDLNEDPSERYNVASEYPAEVKRLVKRIEEFSLEVGAKNNISAIDKGE